MSVNTPRPGELAALWRPPVANVVIPVTANAYHRLRGSFHPEAREPVDAFLIQVGDIPARGLWVLVGLREDYAISGNRTYWATFEWQEDVHGQHG